MKTGAQKRTSENGNRDQTTGNGNGEWKRQQFKGDRLMYNVSMSNPNQERNNNWQAGP